MCVFRLEHCRLPNDPLSKVDSSISSLSEAVPVPEAVWTLVPESSASSKGLLVVGTFVSSSSGLPVAGAAFVGAAFGRAAFGGAAFGGAGGLAFGGAGGLAFGRTRGPAFGGAGGPSFGGAGGLLVESLAFAGAGGPSFGWGGGPLVESLAFRGAGGPDFGPLVESLAFVLDGPLVDALTFVWDCPAVGGGGGGLVGRLNVGWGEKDVEDGR